MGAATNLPVSGDSGRDGHRHRRFRGLGLADRTPNRPDLPNGCPVNAVTGRNLESNETSGIAGLAEQGVEVLAEMEQPDRPGAGHGIYRVPT
ncbi:hypothetical protein Acy02nite_82250 [Actinoplanes cyaneus]|uniref:Uncharacterized protein n=1 Tax=Actinoplanes cyaneus TaxID=52696 RepID=A0A919IRB3_9ACTN|nr:hypothetical protein Acy02nite_82250 [Actinoplanes cyaneus]